MSRRVALCPAGTHAMTDANTSWQFSGNGWLFARCRECNRLRAAAWRKANAHRLDYRRDKQGHRATRGGKQLRHGP